MVRAAGPAALRHVAGASGSSAQCRGGQGPARASVGAWTERLCVRLGERPFRAAMEDGALRLRDGVRTMTLSDRLWRSVTVLVRLDMAAGIDTVTLRQSRSDRVIVLTPSLKRSAPS